MTDAARLYTISSSVSLKAWASGKEIRSNYRTCSYKRTVEHLVIFRLQPVYFYELQSEKYCVSIINSTLVLLKSDIPCPCKQCRSRSVANWSRSALFAIKYVNLYQQPGSSNLIGWKLEVVWFLNLFSRKRVNYALMKFSADLSLKCTRIRISYYKIFRVIFEEEEKKS